MSACLLQYDLQELFPIHVELSVFNASSAILLTNVLAAVEPCSLFERASVELVDL
jgi:hypothetical protein